MDPENENQEHPTGEEPSAVVVDLLESDTDKQLKPLTVDKAGDKGGEGEADDEGANTRVNGSAAGDDDDDELSSAPKTWKKRLKREMRQKIEARAETATERVLREAAETRAETAEAEVTRLRQAPVTPDVSGIDAKIDAATARLEKAIEDGNSKDQAAIQRELADLAGQKHVKLAAPPRREEPPPRQQQQRQQPAKGPTPTGTAFIKANAAWWDDPDHAAERGMITAIDRQLIQEGSDANSEDHYARIAKRAKAKGLKVSIRQPFDDGEDMGNDTTVDLDEPAERRRNTPPQGGNGSGRARVNTELRDAKAGKIVLQLGQNYDGPDADVMRTFKLDPRNKEHVRAFAKSRQERLLQGAE